MKIGLLNSKTKSSTTFKEPRCDRSYGSSCALWQHIGLLLLAGPVNAPHLETCWVAANC